MKVPMPLVSIGGHLRDSLVSIRGFIGGCADAATTAFRRAVAPLSRHRSGRAPSQLALFVGLGVSVVALFLLLALVALRTGSQPVSIEASRLQAAGRAIASSLVVPGEGAWPWPLALEPRSRYTEADAAEIRPDLGAIDVTSLTTRRKAQLESILEAVD